MWHAGMPALAFDDYLEAVGRSRHGPPAYADRPDREAGPHVLGEDSIGLVLPEHPFFHHPLGSAGRRRLLGGLEDEQHTAGKRRPGLIQQQASPHQHRRVRVVTAEQCITPSFSETKSWSFSSCKGNASISARQATVLPVLSPYTMPSTPN